MLTVEFKSCTYQRFLFEIVEFCNYSLKRNNAHQQTRIKSEFIFMFSFVLLCSHHHQNDKKCLIIPEIDGDFYTYIRKWMHMLCRFFYCAW